MIFYSAEARGYGVAMALCLASTLLLLKAVEDDRGRSWVGYGAVVCLAAYTHYTVVFVLAIQLCWAFWAHPRARRSLLLATGGAAVLYLPWLPSLKGDLDSPTTLVLGAAVAVRPRRGPGVPWGTGASGTRTTSRGLRLNDVPGTPALVMLCVGLVLGAIGAATNGAARRGDSARRRGARC